MPLIGLSLATIAVGLSLCAVADLPARVIRSHDFCLQRCCNVLQRTAMHCTVLQNNDVGLPARVLVSHDSLLQRHCNVLQYSATHYSTLQRTATLCKHNTTHRLACRSPSSLPFSNIHHTRAHCEGIDSDVHVYVYVCVHKYEYKSWGCICICI